MRFKKPLLGASLLVLLVLNADVIFISTVNPVPPPRPEPAPIRHEQITNDAGIRRLGPCWWREHRGQHVMYLEGDPYTRGFCNAALADEILDLQHQTLEDAFARIFPSRLVQLVAARAFLALYRHVPAYLTDADRLEILGLSEGRVDPWVHLAPTYGRVIYYHAIHEISQAMVDSPLIACTAFAATAERTTNGHTLLARTFDFEAGRVFDEHKVVIFVRPRVGYAFVHVAWGGMAGAVSGFNETGLGVVLNAAGSDRFDTKGRPTILVLRTILNHARTIDEAIRIVRSADVFISDIFTIADAKTGELAAIEIAPDQVQVRRGDNQILTTNHFMHPSFRLDRENQRRLEEQTTGRRLRRLQEVLQTHQPLDIPQAIRVLRDRRLAGNQRAPLGHRGTIDALIAAHAVVFDLTARMLYVSAAPHTLGEFVRYDFNAIIAGRFSDRGALPADPILTNGRYAALEEARSLVEQAERSDPVAAEALLVRALERSPEHPPALLELARLCAREAKTACARSAYRRYLATNPAYRKDTQEAEKALRAMGHPTTADTSEPPPGSTGTDP